MCVYLYLYIHIYSLKWLYTLHPHILCKQKRLFWMWLIMINHLTLTALIYTHTLIIYKFLNVRCDRRIDLTALFCMFFYYSQQFRVTSSQVWIMCWTQAVRTVLNTDQFLPFRVSLSGRSSYVCEMLSSRLTQLHH